MIEWDIWGSILIYTKNGSISWFNNKYHNYHKQTTYIEIL